MTIKKLQKGDIKSALELVWSVFEEFEAPDYSEQGINEFKEFISLEAVMDTDSEKTVNGIRFTPMEYRLVGL